jgi:hypothetical protein
MVLTAYFVLSPVIGGNIFANGARQANHRIEPFQHSFEIGRDNARHLTDLVDRVEQSPLFEQS